jgi:ribosome biogenesis protein SSF1/2
LNESKKNSIKDFIGVAGLFGVTHMLIFTQTANGNYLRIIKNPKGPTLTFKIDEYALASDVVKFTQKERKQSKIFSTILQAAPLLIMNGFKAAEEGEDKNDVMKIVSLML